MVGSFVYSSKDQILKYLQEIKAENKEVEELIKLYEQTKNKSTVSLEKRKNLFIVFEGLDGSGKSTMTRMVSKTLNAVQVATPPPCVQNLRSYFDRMEPKLRRAYYSLGNYIAAMEIESILSQQHVVMDRFWHSTSAYALAESSEDIPSAGDPVYEWPVDLLKPDVIIFLNVKENERLRRTARRQATMEEDKLKEDNDFRARLYEVFNCLKGLTHINSNSSPKSVFKDIMDSTLKPLIEKQS